MYRNDASPWPTCGVNRRSSSTIGRLGALCLSFGTAALYPFAAAAADWPLWCGRTDRNRVSQEKNLPTEWDVTSRKNIRWATSLGSSTFGNPAVRGGKVFIGTNNGGKRDPKIEGDKGILMCLAASDGRFLWQAVHDKLPDKEAHDWAEIGICSTPCVTGDRLYYVSNRAELVCLDTEGFTDGENDGVILDEAFQGPAHADFVWVLDMMKDLGVRPHQASASAPLVVGNLVFVVTGNGFDFDEEKVPAPKAPSFIAVNRSTGKLVWADHSPGDRIIEGQWSSPAHGQVGGRPQVVFAGGDGWLYAFELSTGKPIWRFDCRFGSKASGPGTKENHLVATPVIHDNRAYIAVGQNPENGKGPGRLWAIDASQAGDVTSSGCVWQRGGKDFGRSLSTVAISDGLLYAADLRGNLHCLEAATGRPVWHHDLDAPTWSSPLVADGKVYIANEDGDVTVLAHGRELKVIARNSMKETVHGSLAVADGVLYLATQTRLYAIASPPTTAPISTRAATAPRHESQADWPMFRGNPHLTGVAACDLPMDLTVAWKVDVGDAVESSAAIVGNSVYVGSDKGVLHALSLGKGETRWEYDAKTAIRSSPLIHNGTAYFGDDRGVFHAVDSHTGKVKWTYRTRGQIISSANAVGDRIVFGSYDNNLYCLSERTGELIWKCRTEDKVHATAAIAGDQAVFAGCDGRLHLVRIDDGSAAGDVPLEGPSASAAAIRGDHTYIGTMSNRFLAIDTITKRIDWWYERSEQPQPFYASAAVTDHVAVVGSRDRSVYAFDLKSGKLLWSFATKGRVDASPVVVGRRVFIGSDDGMLYAVDLSDGRALWRFETGSAILASPAVGQGRLVIGTEDGIVYCFGPKG